MVVLRLMLLSFLALGVIVSVLFHRPLSVAFNGWQLSQQVNLELTRRNWAAVHELCERGLHDNLNNPVLLKGLAAYYYCQDPAQARIWYARLVKYQPDDTSSRLAYAHLLAERLHQPDAALSVLWEGTQRNPGAITQFVQLMGNIYFKEASDTQNAENAERLYRLALTYYQLVLKQNPRHYDALFQAGRAEERLKDYPVAATDFCHCIVLNPQSYAPQYNLGYSLLSMGYKQLGFRWLSHSIQMTADRGDIDTARWLSEKSQSLRNVFADSKEAETENTSPAMRQLAAVDDIAQLPDSLKSAGCLAFIEQPGNQTDVHEH